MYRFDNKFGYGRRYFGGKFEMGFIRGSVKSGDGYGNWVLISNGFVFVVMIVIKYIIFEDELFGMLVVFIVYLFVEEFMMIRRLIVRFGFNKIVLVIDFEVI